MTHQTSEQNQRAIDLARETLAIEAEAIMTLQKNLTQKMLRNLPMRLNCYWLARVALSFLVLVNLVILLEKLRQPLRPLDHLLFLFTQPKQVTVI